MTKKERKAVARLKKTVADLVKHIESIDEKLKLQNEMLTYIDKVLKIKLAMEI